MELPKKTYLLTGGVVSLLENRHGLSLSDKCEREIENLEEEYAKKFAGILNGYVDPSGKFEWEVRFTSSKNIESSLREVVSRRNSGRPLISLDDIYCTDLPDAFYSVTRTMNPNALEEGTKLGPRYGYPSLQEQTRKIVKDFGNEIDIMDIGTFEGETITGEIAQRFKKEGLNINGVYLVFAGKIGIANLQKNGLNLEYKEAMDWVDWLEIRDCVGFDGRKVERSCSDKDIVNAFIRYTYNSESWASIPSKFKDVFEELYCNSFEQIRHCLGKDNYDVNLTKSRENTLVNELRIHRK